MANTKEYSHSPLKKNKNKRKKEKAAYQNYLPLNFKAPLFKCKTPAS